MLDVSCGSRLAVGSSARMTVGAWARARDGDPLLLASRECVGATVGEVREAHLRQALEREPLLARREAADEARKRRHVAEPSREDVVQHRGATHEVELLEDHPDLAPDLAQLGGVATGHGATSDTDPTRRRLGQPVDRAQERGLAGPAPAEDDDELARADGEIDLLEGHRVGREHDGEPRDLDHQFHLATGSAQRGRTPSSSIAARTGS